MNLKTTRLASVTVAIFLFASSLAAQQRVNPMVFRFVEMDEARDLMNSGNALYDNGKFAEAAEKYKEVLRKYPRNTVADHCQYLLMRALAMQNKVGEALLQADQF